MFWLKQKDFLSEIKNFKKRRRKNGRVRLKLKKEENLKIEQRVEKFLTNEITVLLYILTI